MTAAFGTRKKRRLNRVMDALNFEDPDYERLGKEAWGAKKKRIVSILKRQAMRSIKKDKQRAASKKEKISVEPKLSAPKKRKSSTLAPIEAKIQDPSEKIASTSSSSYVGVTGILKVMTELFPFAMLSPLGHI
jgi:U3 small nucleolar RNA-associated protein 14